MGNIITLTEWSWRYCNCAFINLVKPHSDQVTILVVRTFMANNCCLNRSSLKMWKTGRRNGCQVRKITKSFRKRLVGVEKKDHWPSRVFVHWVLTNDRQLFSRRGRFRLVISVLGARKFGPFDVAVKVPYDCRRLNPRQIDKCRDPSSLRFILK